MTYMESNIRSYLFRVVKIVAVVWAIALALASLIELLAGRMPWNEAFLLLIFIGLLPAVLMWLLGTTLLTVGFSIRSKLSTTPSTDGFSILSDPSVRNVVLIIVAGIISAVIAGLVLAHIFGI